MKRILAVLIGLALVFSFSLSAVAFEAQDKLTPAPEILSFSTDGEMTEFSVSLSHSLSSAEELRELVYSLALEKYKTEEALLASPDGYLACKTGLYLEMSTDSHQWSSIRQLAQDSFTLTAEDVLAFIGDGYYSRVFLRICLASENYLDGNAEKVYIYTPSEASVIYLTPEGTLIPTEAPLVFSEAPVQSIPLFIPTVDGYDFDGWSGEDTVRINKIPEGTGKIRLSAHLIPRRYEINYVISTVPGVSFPFGSANLTDHPTEYEVGTTTKIGSIVSTVTGYSFGGWYASADFSGDRITQIGPTETGDRLLYAKWISDEETENKKMLERLQYISDNFLGDPDGDGSVTAADARYVLRASVGLEQPDYERLSRVDYYNTGMISSANARTTLRISVGLDSLYDILLENGLLP